MRRLNSWIGVIAVVGTIGLVQAEPNPAGVHVSAEKLQPDTPKTEICHLAKSGTGHVIRIASAALPAHLSHGDCREFALDESGRCSCPLSDLLAGATFAARLDLPRPSTFDLAAIQADPAYADGSLEQGFLVFRERELADYPSPSDPCCDPQPIPAGIGIQFALGSNGSLWTFTDAALPQAYLALFGIPTEFSRRPTQLWPTQFNFSAADLDVLWSGGLRFGTDWNDKFLTLPQLGMRIYTDLRSRGFVISPVSDVDLMLHTSVRVLNRSGRRVAIGLAKIAADCLRQWHPEYPDRWWPKGSADPCGTAEWGANLASVNPGPEWFAYAVAYGDNGTTQTVTVDGAVFAYHVNYGADERVSVSPGPLPAVVTLGHTNVWSGNVNDYLLMLQADEFEFTDLWESPSVGPLPQPIVRFFETGWN